MVCALLGRLHGCDKRPLPEARHGPGLSFTEQLPPLGLSLMAITGLGDGTWCPDVPIALSNFYFIDLVTLILPVLDFWQFIENIHLIVTFL